MIYSFNCCDIKIEKYTSVQFAADPFPLEQNCDFLEIYKISDHNELCLFYDDGTKRAVYSPCFENIFIDSKKQSVSIWISTSNQIDEDPKNEFTMIDIRIKNPQVFHRLKEVFTFDKMIAFEDWIYTLADIDKMNAINIYENNYRKTY